MTVAFVIGFLALGTYLIFMFRMAYGFMRTTPHKKDVSSFSSFTIIICARNEEKYIGRCIGSILEQDYEPSLVEILLINDAGTDSTVTIAGALLSRSRVRHRIITQPARKGKKECITYAMQFASHERIVLRDADTYTESKNWLKGLNRIFQNEGPDMVIGPVAISDNSGSLWALQAIENNVLQVISCGSAHYGTPFLCSGANLAFTPALFQKTSGFLSHAHIPSGDDVLFLEDARKKGALISYLRDPECLVRTYPCYTFENLISQKVRWASKFRFNSNPLNLFTAVLVFLVNVLWTGALVYGFAEPLSGTVCLIFMAIKLIIDFLLLFLAAGFIRNRGLLWYAVPVGFIYPVYSCIIAFLSVFRKPAWKP